MNWRHFFTFLLLQGIVWSIAALAYFQTNGFFTDPVGLSFSFFFLIGHIFLFVWLLALLALPFCWISPRACRIACIGWGSLFSALLAINWVVFSQYRFHIGLAMLELFFGPAADEIFVFPLQMHVLLEVGLILIIAFEFILSKIATRYAFSNKTMIIAVTVWLLSFFAYNGLYAWGSFMQIPSIVGQRNTLPLAYPMSANRFLTKLGFKPQQKSFSLPSKGALHYPLAPLACTTPSHLPNILFLVVDSWRADTFTPEVMPRLSSWAEKTGMSVFTNHLSGGNSTASGIFSLFYSMPQSYWEDVTSRHQMPVFIEHLLTLGYQPAIFASSKLNSPTFDRNVFVGIDNLRLGSAGKTSWQRDENAIADFETFLHTRNKQQPFFGFIFLDSPHAYNYPAHAKKFTPTEEMNYLLLTNSTDPTPYMNHYKNAVYYVDELFDRTLQQLKQQHLLDNTILIITADHSQELNDSHLNFWGHNSNFTDYQTQVPLLVYQPNKPYSVKQYSTSHYDIIPTLLQTVFQCTNPISDYSIGFNLFDVSPRPFVAFSGHTEKALRIDDTLLVFDLFGGIKQYSNRLEPVTQAPEPSRIKAGLKAFSHFYKKDRTIKK